MSAALHLKPPEESGISGVPIDMVWNVWPLVSHYFASFQARSQGEVPAGELLKLVLEGKRQMWVAVMDGQIKACALTQVLETPMKTIQLDFCAGEDRNEWRDDMIAEIERWGLEMIGSRRLRIVCRPGWAREIKGYRETHRVIEKDLGNG